MIARIPCYANRSRPIAWPISAIAVGPPVTRRPPHRSRRADFPHRAPQRFSLPHRGSSSRLCRWSPDPRPWNLEVLQHRSQTSPRVTPGLATPVQPLVQDPHRREVELPQAATVAVDPEVTIVAQEFPVQLSEQIPHPPMAVRPTPDREPAQRCPQAPARRPALQVRTALAVPSPAELEAQEVFRCATAAVGWLPKGRRSNEEWAASTRGGRAREVWVSRPADLP